MTDIERECISCGEKGHWYLDCPKVPFFALFGACFDDPISQQVIEDSGGIGKISKALSKATTPNRPIKEPLDDDV